MPAATLGRQQDRQEAEAQRHQRQRHGQQPLERPSKPDLAGARDIEPDAEQAHAGGLADEGPEGDERAAAEQESHQTEAENPPDREPISPTGGRRHDRGDQPGSDREREADERQVDRCGDCPSHQAHLVRLGLVVGSPEQPVRRALEGVIERFRDHREPPADVGDQPHTLLGDRGPHLRRLRNPLHQHLRLRARENLAPHLVGDLGVERPYDRVRQLVAGQRLVKRPPDGVLLDEHPDDGPFDGRAAHGADDRLLGGVLDRLVDPGGAGEPLGPARAGPEHPSGGRARPRRPLHLTHGATVAAPRVVQAVPWFPRSD